MKRERTDSNEEVIGHLEFLARSTNRIQILELLANHAHAGKDELQASIEADRTTLTRNLDALDERGWIRTGNPTCTITPAGRDIVDEFLDLEETVEVAARFQEFFRWLSADELDLDIRELADARLFSSASGDPLAMVNRHVEKIRGIKHERALLSLTGLHAYEAAHEQVVENDAQIELVVDQNVADTFQSDSRYKELTSEMATTGRFDVYVYNGRIPYALCLLDETVQIGVDEEGEPRALLETESAAVRDWAEETYEAYKAQATQVI